MQNKGRCANDFQDLVQNCPNLGSQISFPNRT
jgi:hypothetical protein